MLDHIHAMDKQMVSMCQSLKQLGSEIDIDKLPHLGPCEIEEQSNKRDDSEKPL
jgi:hypothetical protein